MKTLHIRQLLAESISIAEQAEQAHYAPGEDTAKALERAANLASHAGEELRDEMLRERDGWPFI